MDNVNLKTLTSLNLAGHTLTGNVTITSEANGTLDIKSGTITGNLIVDAKNATVNNNSTVNGTITIKDVSDNTWNELVSVNKLIFEAKGKTLKIADKVAGLTIKANATIITSNPVQAIVDNGIKVTVKASANATEEIKIDGTGKEVNLDPKKPAPEMVKVTFESNGGNAVNSIEVEKGKTIELPVTPTRDGFTFVGWFTDDGTFENKFTGETPVTENITVYAKWEKIVEDQVAPTEVKGLAPTTEENKDGKITGVTTEMEYRLKGEENFKAVTGTEIIGLTAGKYEVRFKAKDGYNASPVTEVEVPAYVAEETILEAPADGATEFTIKLEEEEGLDIKYLAFGLMNEANSAQKVATLEDVKSHLKKEYGVDFKSENIKLDQTNKTLSITGQLLSTEDWNKVKEEGKKDEPYRITVLNKDKSNKLVKIAIYEDGKAVFHNTKNELIKK